MRLGTDIRLSNLDELNAAREETAQKIDELQTALSGLAHAICKMGAEVIQPESSALPEHPVRRQM